MKGDESPTIPTTTSINPKKETSDSTLFAKTRYKFWALAAILLLAFWSMFTGTVTLKWSAGNLTNFSDEGVDNPLLDDLDVLEVEEREKAVRHMWDLYTHGSSTKLPRFWREAFEAAYRDLATDVVSVRNAAVSEIAKMSIRSAELAPPNVVQSTNTEEMKIKSYKEAEKNKKAAVITEESKQ